MPSVKFSEHSDRPGLIELLKIRLGIKFKIYQEVIYIDSLGKKQQADIVIFDAEKIDIISNALKWTSDDTIVAVIETKIQQEDNLENHERQLFDYLNILKSRIGFLTNYHDISSYLFIYDTTNPEKRHYSSDKLEEIADFIVDTISKNVQIPIQKTPEEIIKFLESSVNDLTKFTSKISGDEWEKILRLSDSLEIEVKKKELSKEELFEREKFFQTSAAYIAIAQILFYITFRQFRLDKGENENPVLRSLSSANGIPTQLQEVLEDIPNNDLNFKAIFGKNQEVFIHLDDETAPVLKELVKHLEGISAKFVIENDLIGQIFQRLMPYETRKTCHRYPILPVRF
jgi:dsDNA-binding SOS-regulon protein